jgi:hypothetical protein
MPAQRRPLIRRYLQVVLVLPAVAIGLQAASQEARPACSAARVGDFWPEAANTDKEMAQSLVRSGELSICTRTPEWRYRWDQLSITINQLSAKHHGSKDLNSTHMRSAESPSSEENR